tara:strand:+ start:470 stop:976 length:507 start_codon:yes stop_codon:yes gene_type:complete
MKIRKALLFLMSSLLLVGCGNYKTKTSEIKTTVMAEGPFFEGSNSLIGEVQLNYSEFLEDKEFNKVAEVTINQITVELEDNQELSLEQFSSAAIQLVSDNSPMTSIAIMNPIKINDNKLQLTVSNEAKVTSFFQEEKFSLLLDLDFKEDSYAEELKATIKINLSIEYK